MRLCVISLDEVPATGTGTLIIQLEDVNDNAPVIEERSIKVCLFNQNLNSCHVFNHILVHHKFMVYNFVTFVIWVSVLKCAQF